jgi:hypothetical protein
LFLSCCKLVLDVKDAGELVLFSVCELFDDIITGCRIFVFVGILRFVFDDKLDRLTSDIDA